MALVFTDLTKETTSTTGTGTLTLTGAVDKYQSFANIGTGNTTYYRIESGNDSEVGLGTYNGTLSRDTVYMSIIAGVAGTTKIDVANGATVSCVYPAEKAVVFDANDVLTIPDASAFKWSSDVALYRDAANTIAQRNAANSQASRVYNTYSDASNYARASLSFVTYSGALYTKLAAESAGTGAANIGIALSPKGTGAITAQVPDGTTAGGNARGANSVDLQTYPRTLPTQVASGSQGSVAIGARNIASADGSIAIGQGNTSSGTLSVALGMSLRSRGVCSTAFGFGGEAAGYYSTVIGKNAFTDKKFQVAFGFDSRNGQPLGESQASILGFVGITTDATLAQLFLGDVSNERATIPNSTTWAADIDIVARSSGGTENAYFKRRLVIQKGTTAASTALIGTVQTVGTDIGSANMLLIATPITLTADTTNGALKLEVTGIAATNIRWVAKVSLVEVGYA